MGEIQLQGSNNLTLVFIYLFFGLITLVFIWLWPKKYSPTAAAIEGATEEKGPTAMESNSSGFKQLFGRSALYALSTTSMSEKYGNAV